MSQDLVAAPATSTPASSAWSVAPGTTPLTFRKDTDDGFPIGGAILLVVLMVAAVWAWWYGRIRGGRDGQLPGLLAAWGKPTDADNELRIAASLPAAGGMRLVVVEWAGGRRVLVGINGTNAPVTLDVMPRGLDQGETTP